MELALRDNPAETAVDVAAAAVFAAASAFAASALFGWVAVPAGLLASIPVFLLLRQVQRDTICHVLPIFQPEALPEQEYGHDELLLTAEMALKPSAIPSDELVLDDVLAALEPDSRVVRLFDPDQMPTPGEFKANIDLHLHRAQAGPNPPDATQALSDALAQLRRSLH